MSNLLVKEGKNSWIGLRLIQIENGSYTPQWVNGDPVLDFKMWAQFEPCKCILGSRNILIYFIFSKIFTPFLIIFITYLYLLELGAWDK